ncbi:uncharacterized protein LOC109721962 [Ananas comosus]|uniref:Uncharacterized protein LOC109721962 n=1 Tax=Ananas comosus TaxID=4615 RepID=A0A6P5GB56_ANACO|nr:uncharacterized protein LOC109721962 [Ananas comosus]
MATRWFRKLQHSKEGRRGPRSWKPSFFSSFSPSWKWTRLSFRFSLVDDVLFRILSVVEAVVLVLALSCFFLCCGCQF